MTGKGTFPELLPSLRTTHLPPHPIRIQEGKGSGRGEPQWAKPLEVPLSRRVRLLLKSRAGAAAVEQAVGQVAAPGPLALD